MPNWETPEQKDFLKRRSDVAARAVRLFTRLGLDGLEPTIDYLSIFTESEAEQQRLSRTVAKLGRFICDKNGPVYRLRSTIDSTPVLPALVRARSPQNTRLLGCADFIVDDYERARHTLVEQDGYTETEKAIDGHSYTIIEVVDRRARVAAYFPSQPMSELMGA